MPDPLPGRPFAGQPSRIVCIHATPRAVEPAHKMLAQRPGEFHWEDLLVEELLESDRGEAEGVALFAETVRRADRMAPAAILTTCSLYTRFLPEVRQQVATPVVGVDEPLIERAAASGGRLALVGSLPNAIARTGQQILRRARELRLPTSVELTRIVSPDACETAEGIQRLANEIRELNRRADAVVVVQLSLSGVTDCLSAEERVSVLTAPGTALERLREVLSGR